MKKLIMIATFATVSAFADVSLDLANAGTVYNQSFGEVASGSTVLLIYNSAAPTGTSGDSLTLSAEGLIDGSSEVLFGSYASTGNGAKFSGLGGVFADGDNGVADVNTGYFYLRIFDGAFGSSGYLTDSYSIGYNGSYLDNSVSNVGEAVNAGTGLPEIPTSVFGLETASEFALTETSYSVIPEPATIGLLGIAGAGLFAARRKS